MPSVPSPFPHVAPPAQAPARTAAQRAFFQAALGKAAAMEAPVAPVAPGAGRTVQVAAQPVEPASPEVPRKIPRPGSILDIKV